MASIFKFTYSLKHEFFTVGDFQTALSSLTQVFAWELHFRFSPTLTFQTEQHEGQQTDQHEGQLHPET